MALKDYQSKRNFDKTSEPQAAEAKPSNSKEASKGKSKLRFVVQRHAATRLHYDFRLEMEGVLKSWAVPKGPSLDPEDRRLAMHVEDHPYAYKDFEGRIPDGNYGAGQVEIWDEGTYTPVKDGKAADEKEALHQLHTGSLKFRLQGKKLKGEFALVKMKNSEEDAWLLIKHKDAHSQSPYDAEQHTDVNSAVTQYLQEKKSPNPSKSAK